MEYTEEQFAKALELSAKKCGLDAHISWLDKKANMCTYADRIIGVFYRKGMAIKKSYMYCDSLDMTFFFFKNGEAVYTHSGYVDKRDATEEKIVNAFRKANEMRVTMEHTLKEVVKEVQNVN